jgi:hypothetical protein
MAERVIEGRDRFCVVVVHERRLLARCPSQLGNISLQRPFWDIYNSTAHPKLFNKRSIGSMAFRHPQTQAGNFLLQLSEAVGDQLGLSL